MTFFENIKEATIQGNSDKTIELARQGIAAEIDANEIIQSGLITAMAEVGERFKQGLIFVPEMLIAARAMQGALKVVKPYLKGEEVKGLASIVIGTVKGD
ncbi:methionine synthase [Peptococcaceae bacterium CEB3]|nr:methionine synthase [Peptococcaceae bacterium CEB3]